MVLPQVINSSVFGHIDFLGLPPSNIEEVKCYDSETVGYCGVLIVMDCQTILLREEKANTNISFVIISDLWLDQPKACAKSHLTR